jgi:hypothetical protein
MCRWAALACTLLAIGCGRIGFSPIGGDATGDAMGDAGPTLVAQEGYLKASNTGAFDSFGKSVALSADGSTLAVGAHDEASAATGIDGNQADNTAPNSGAVYVFRRAGSTWSQEAYIKPSNTGAGDAFGWSVALSADGSTLAVGALTEDSAATDVGGAQNDNAANDAGAVYVFVRAGATWSQQAYVKASNTETNDWFGYSLALSASGSTLAASALYEDSATFGVDGNQASNGQTNAGAVYVFTRSGTTWSQQAYLKASNTGANDELGHSVALSGDGNTLAVGAWGEASGATGVDGNQADDATIDAGAVYVFTRSGTSWSQHAYVKASNTGASDWFGHGVTLSADGTTLAVAALREDSAGTDAGTIYVFARSAGTWVQQALLGAANADPGDELGASLALSGSGTVLAVGCGGEDSAATGIDGDQASNAADGAGAVYLFERAGGTWSQTKYIKASNPATGDGFGASVALSADATTLAVSAIGEDSGATGIGGAQTDESADTSGAVYLFH